MGGMIPLVVGCGGMPLEEETASRGGWRCEEKAGGGVMLLTASCSVMPLDGGGVVIGVRSRRPCQEGTAVCPKMAW